MNLNPVASGNKTQSGVGGLISLAIGGAVMAVLKQMGIDDTTGAISGAVASTVISGGLFVWGLIHRVIKTEKIAYFTNTPPAAPAEPKLVDINKVMLALVNDQAPAPAPVGTSIDPAPKQPESVPEKTAV